MDIPEDLGQRILEAARLALALHLQPFPSPNLIPGGTVSLCGGATTSIGGADPFRGAATDGPHSAADCEAA